MQLVEPGQVVREPAVRRMSPKQINSELELRREEHKAVMEELQRKSPMYASTIKPPGFSLDKFKQQISTDWCPMEFYLTEDNELVIIYIDDQEEFPYSNKLDKKMESIKTYLSNLDKMKQELQINMESALKYLTLPAYSMLIPPEIEERIKKHKLLIISPHGLLHYIPFHALKNNGKYLIEDIS